MPLFSHPYTVISLDLYAEKLSIEYTETVQELIWESAEMFLEDSSEDENSSGTTGEEGLSSG